MQMLWHPLRRLEPHGLNARVKTGLMPESMAMSGSAYTTLICIYFNLLLAMITVLSTKQSFSTTSVRLQSVRRLTHIAIHNAINTNVWPFAQSYTQ